MVDVEVNCVDGSKDKHALLFCVLKTFKRQLLSAVLPRLALIAFTFAQPFLINRVIRFVDEPTTPLTKSIGYGLIGATSLIFLGISVSLMLYIKTGRSASHFLNIY